MSLVPGLPPAGRAAVRAGIVGNYVDQVNIFLPVVALTMESSITTMRLPFTISRSAFNFNFTPKWRIESLGSMKVRPT